MARESKTDGVLTQTEAAERLRVTPHTIRRWMDQGIGNPPVKLGFIPVGGIRKTTIALCDKFVDERAIALSKK